MVIKAVKTRMLCTIIALLVLFVLPFSTAVHGDETETPEGYTRSASRGNLTLFYNTGKQAVAVRNNRTGYVWYSALPQEQIPEGTTRLLADQLSSLFLLSYSEINITSGKLTDESSVALEPEVTVENIENGFRYVFYVKTLNLRLVIEFSLDDDGLVVSVPSDRIEEGIGTDAQIEEGKPPIIKFIEECREIADTLDGDPDLPSSYTNKLSSFRKEVDRLESLMNAIKSAVAIEKPVDDMTSCLKKIEAIAIGDSRTPGILMNIRTSQLTDSVKKKYTNVQELLDEFIDATELSVAFLKAIRVASVVELVLNPNFGSAGDSVDGYMFYPDGSGAITHFKTVHPQYTSFFKRDIYTDDKPDIDWENRKNLMGLTDVMLPVIGVKHGNNAVAAIIVDGDTDAYVDFRPSGYLVNVNRMGFGFRYRRTVEGSSKSGEFVGSGATVQYEMERKELDVKVKYMFLDGEGVGYSEMAGAVRDEYKKSGQMKTSSQYEDNRALAAVTFEGASNHPMLMFDNYDVSTSYRQAAEIINDIARNTDVKLMAEMYDWYSGKSIKARPIGAMGGSSGLRTLTDMAKECDSTLFFWYNGLVANMSTTGYKDSELAVANNLRILTSNFSKRMLLSPDVMVRKYNEQLPKFEDWGIEGVMLRGSFIFYDYKPGNKIQRAGTVEKWREMFAMGTEKLGHVAAYGGNKYVLDSVDWIMEIPSETTGYVYTDEAVPLYQMIVHGSVPYSGKSVNTYYDAEYEKLQAIELGYVPTYQLCYKLPKYSSGYVSVYEHVRDELISLFNEYNENLACVAGAAMTHHSRAGDIAHVMYDNGVEIYLNYGNTAAQCDAGEIPAKDYIVTGGRKGDIVEKEISEYAAPRESNGISVPLAVGGGILLLLLLSAAVFAHSRVRKGHKRNDI